MIPDPCEHIIERGGDDGRCAACAYAAVKAARFVVVPHAQHREITNRGFVVRELDRPGGAVVDQYNYGGVPMVCAFYTERGAQKAADRLNAARVAVLS